MLSRLVSGLAAIALLAGCSGGDGDPPTQPPPGGGNHSPTVNLSMDKAHLAYGETAQLAVTAPDNDGDQVTFTWSAVRGTVTSSGPTATSVIFTAGQEWGVVTVTVTASDGRGGTAQATAQSYIRNPNPPSLQLAAVAGSFAQCEGFCIQVTPNEAILVTKLLVQPLDVGGACDYSRDYSSSPVSIAVAQSEALRGQGVDCIWYECSNQPVSRYAVTVYGRRPEPDGGSFTVTCARFDPSDGSCN